MPKTIIFITLGIFLCLCALLVEEKLHPQKQWELTDVRGYLPDLEFSLTDDNGKNIIATDYHGQVVMLYFGFTQCATECPTTLLRLSTILKQMGKNADTVIILFVSIDPKHDTPKVLKDYLQSFDAKHMIGLSGDKETIEAMEKRYQAAILKNDNKVLQHSSTIYIFDTSGHARLLANDGDSDKAIINDLGHLVNSLK